jgi:signal transduction histidine kinase
VQGVAVDLDLHLGGQRLAPELESTVYRLAQEALTNVGKHALADQVSLRLAESDGVVELEVADDGRGFDPELTDSGYGLVGMRERAELAGGRLEVESRPGAGTTVRARLPRAGPAR